MGLDNIIQPTQQKDDPNAGYEELAKEFLNWMGKPESNNAKDAEPKETDLKEIAGLPMSQKTVSDGPSENTTDGPTDSSVTDVIVQPLQDINIDDLDIICELNPKQTEIPGTGKDKHVADGPGEYTPPVKDENGPIFTERKLQEFDWSKIFGAGTPQNKVDDSLRQNFISKF